MKTKEKKIKTPLTGERQTNFEFYRIILMLLVVMHHFVVNSGVMDAIVYDLSARRALLYLTVGMWGQSALNGFALISGYFMCNKNITAKKYARLLAEIMFYRLLFAAVFWCAALKFPAYGQFGFTWKALITALIPVTNVKDSEIQAVLVVYLCIPFLNKLLHALTKKQHLLLLVLFGFVFTFCSTFNFMTFAAEYIPWFCAVYCIGAFVGMHPGRMHRKRELWGLAMLLSMVISFAALLNCVNAKLSPYIYMDRPYKVLPLLNAVFSFLFFGSLKLPQNRFINRVAASAFGVLLIHTAGAPMRRFLWTDLLQVTKGYWLSAPLMLAHVIGCIAGVYVVCTVIDMLRCRFLERPVFRLWDKAAPSCKRVWNRLDARISKNLHLNEKTDEKQA